MNQAEWEQQIRETWKLLDQVSDAEFLARIDDLADEFPSTGGDGVFETASARDSTGHSDRAVALYRTALQRGLSGERRRRAVIQMASSLRNVGQAEESVILLSDERRAGHDSLDDAVAAFLALALGDVGRHQEALSVALTALAPHLPRYQRSLANYALDLVGQGPRDEDG